MTDRGKERPVILHSTVTLRSVVTLLKGFVRSTEYRPVSLRFGLRITRLLSSTK